MPAGWLQNYFNTIQTPIIFKNRNVMCYNLAQNNIYSNIFSLKLAEK